MVGSASESAEDSDKESTNKAVSFLMEKMSEFEYPEVMEGTFDIRMIKQDKEWKINDLSMPHFDKVSLPIK